MKVVIDTSVLVSAALRNRDPERVLMYVVERPDIQWLASEAILAEYREVLSRPKFDLPADLLTRWLNLLERATVLVSIPVEVAFPRDPADAKFLSCALTGQADFLITSDRDFTEARKLLATRIVSVSMFRRLVCEA